MKYLLQATDGWNIIAGLNDRAYLGILDATKEEVVVCELLPPSSLTATKGEQKPQREGKNNEGNDGVDVNNKAQESAQSARSPNEIQAVAIKQKFFENGEKDKLLLAISRHDKTLSIYCYDNNGKDKTETLEPTTVHKTNKRACCLTFACVSPPTTTLSLPLDIIVTGDMVGDVTAFDLCNETNPENCDKNKENKNESNSRLLLGHTASMITGINVVTDNSMGMRILTSDRDEKVRVSSFPQTVVIEGYLLGHTAFISAMDVVSQGSTQCITCSGDNTVRLWDYSSCKELAVTNIDYKESEDDTSGNHASSSNENESMDVENNDIMSERIPTGIASNPNGANTAVIFDKCNEVQIFVIDAKEQNPKILHLQTIACPSQPIAIRFVNDNTFIVLAQEPEYMLAYRKESASSEFTSFDSKVCHAIKQTAQREKITQMPRTILETDPQSGKLKVLKEKESRTANITKPWMRSERKEIAKKRQQRRNKRRRQGTGSESEKVERYSNS